MDQRARMLAGELYDPRDAALSAARARARRLLHAFNATSEDQLEERARVLRELVPHAGAELWIEPPFYCDYGDNLLFGDGVYLNFNCVFLDVARITVGSRVLFGPAVQVYAATHPMRASERRTGLELGKSVTVGDDVWIGGGVILCPGVRVGDRAVVGAGSVVTRDVPEGVFAAGNPCRVVRTVGE